MNLPERSSLTGSVSQSQQSLQEGSISVRHENLLECSLPAETRHLLLVIRELWRQTGVMLPNTVAWMLGVGTFPWGTQGEPLHRERCPLQQEVNMITTMDGSSPQKTNRLSMSFSEANKTEKKNIKKTPCGDMAAAVHNNGTNDLTFGINGHLGSPDSMKNCVDCGGVFHCLHRCFQFKQPKISF